MSVTVVQSTGGNALGVSSLSVSFVSNVTAGNSLVAAFGWSSTTVTATVSDNNGNTWPAGSDASISGVTGSSIAIYHVPNVVGGPTTIKVSFSTPVAASMAIYELSGNVLVDKATENDGTGTSTSSSGSITTTVANDVAIAASTATGATFTASPAGYTMVERSSTGVSFEGDYKTLSGTGTEDPAWTLSTNGSWTGAIAAYYDSTPAALSPQEFDAYSPFRPSNVTRWLPSL